MGGIPNGDTAITWTEATIYNNACRKLGDQGGLYPVKQGEERDYFSAQVHRGA
ncbi:unnamed protein product [Alternaria alternata]